MSAPPTSNVSRAQARAEATRPSRSARIRIRRQRRPALLRKWWTRISGQAEIPAAVEVTHVCQDAATFSVAMTGDIASALAEHLLRADGQEDLAFALYQPSTGLTRTTAILVDVVLPEVGERAVHGNASFSGDYFLRAACLAAERNLGLAFLHSHPAGRGWQGMSRDDYAAEFGHAGATSLITGMPLVGLTLAGRDCTYSARRWRRSVIDDGARESRAAWTDEPATTVRVIGDQIKVSFNDTLVPVPAPTRRSLRTVQSWGKRAHDDLIRLRIGVIGGGSVAQLVAESLVRTGFIHVDILDFDLIEERNLDRLLHATETDIGKAKVSVLVDQLRGHTVTPDAVVHGFDDSVVESEGWLRALDCDVLFSCVDRPWPRFALNVAAYSHLVPVVDGGVAVDLRAAVDPPEASALEPAFRLVGAEWRAHLVGPGHKCMECLGQYDPGEVGMERAGLLDDPKYIASLPADHHLRRGENVFVFSMACAAAEVLELLRAVLGPSKIHDVGATLTHWTTGVIDRDIDTCKPGCPFSNQLLGRGDDAGVDVTGPHPAATAARVQARTEPPKPA